MVNNSPELEKIFVEECMKYNYNIVSKPEFELNENEVVRITSEKNKLGKKRTILDKNDYKVFKQHGNIYELKSTSSDKSVFRPRYEIFSNI